MSRRLWITMGALGAIGVLAAGFRLYDLRTFPAGLHPLEAAAGEDARLVVRGDYRVFYPEAGSREGLFVWLQALALKTFGVGVWQMHVVPAIIGTLTVLAVYFATFPYFGHLAGLFAALFLATSYWHVTLSRVGFRGILAPLFIAAFSACVGFSIRATRAGKSTQAILFGALAGVSFAGGLYTYLPYWVMVGVVVGIILLMLLAALHPAIGFPHGRRYREPLLAGVLVALLLFAPLGWYYVEQPSDFVRQAGEASIFNPEYQRQLGTEGVAETLLYSAREVLRSFFAGVGDKNWLHSVPGYPLLNSLVGMLFLLGLAWTIHGTVSVVMTMLKGKEVHLGMIYPYLLFLVIGLLLPAILTAEGIPNGLQMVGLLVPITMLAGTAAAVGVHFLQRRLPHESARALALGLVVGVIVLGGLYDGALYFLIARNDSEAAKASRSELTEVAQFLKDFEVADDAAPPRLVLDIFSAQPVHLLTTEQAHLRVTAGAEHPDEADHIYRLTEPSLPQLLRLPAGEIVIFTQADLPLADEWAKQQSTLEIVESRRNRFGQEIMRVYRLLPGAGQPSAPLPGPGIFDLDA